MNGKPNIINLLFAILIVLSLFWLARFLYTESSPISRMSYSGFLKMLKEDSSMIAEIALKDDGTVKVSTKDGRIYEIYAPWVLNDSDLINEISSK
ncbi:MAG TPA: cell division protein FtsH, partial [Thermotoga sp.]|nr:cell division protein FtsH [Thermotoga sp.]